LEYSSSDTLSSDIAICAGPQSDRTVNCKVSRGIPGGPEECVVSYADYSESMMNWMLSNPDELLDHSCRGMEGGGRGKLIDMRPVALAGYPGREVTCRRDQGGETWFVRARLYLVDRRLYHLAFASRRQDRIAAKDIDEFLASFKLTSKSAKKGHAE